MRLTKLFTLALIFLGAMSYAQESLYLSPASSKTVSNSLIITSDGNVGIGKASPEDALEVNGRIHAKSVKVDLEGWADFVFASDYELPSLTEMEAYIKKHGHLQGIPSEQEALSQGIDLGEMNTLLLQKVEELTLHLIEKDKKITELEARLARLEALIIKED